MRIAVAYLDLNDVASDTCVDPPEEDIVEFDRNAWLLREIHVHEAQLRGYLRRFLKRSSDLADGIQETYARLLSLPDCELALIRSPHAFLFTVARNVALEALRKQRVISRNVTLELDLVDAADNSPSAYEQLNSREELELLAQAVASLPERRRQVLTLRKLDGLSQKEIAARLGISENTVVKHAGSGVKLCAAYIYAREAAPQARPPASQR
jgi:RNA polymerase sigma factor (sigma-70 family)